MRKTKYISQCDGIFQSKLFPFLWKMLKTALIPFSWKSHYISNWNRSCLVISFDLNYFKVYNPCCGLVFLVFPIFGLENILLVKCTFCAFSSFYIFKFSVVSSDSMFQVAFTVLKKFIGFFVFVLERFTNSSGTQHTILSLLITHRHMHFEQTICLLYLFLFFLYINSYVNSVIRLVFLFLLFHWILVNFDEMKLMKSP